MNKILKLTKTNSIMESTKLNEPNQTPIKDIEEEIESTQETSTEEPTTDSKMELD